jgi:SAM-dependent methyltransferase
VSIRLAARTGASALDTYFSVMAEDHDPGKLRFSLGTTFGGMRFANRSVLDIGAGAGRVSFYAACAGARRVVSLEPEAAGSRSGVQERFMRVRELLGADQVELRSETLQDFDPAGEQFDMLVSMASINHLDEDACMRLQHSSEARETYEKIFSKLADLATPGADLIVCDCSRYNLFAQLGIRNPIVPSIEWEKHQSPKLWAKLLEHAGFSNSRIRWTSFNTLRSPGRLLFGNRVGAYCLRSTFCLTMQRG